MAETLASVIEYGMPAPPTEVVERVPHKFLYDIGSHDAETRLPYFLAPSPIQYDASSPLVSWHHTHHSRPSLSEGGEEDLALRSSCVQLGLNTDHNKGPLSYHNLVRASKNPRSTLGKASMMVFHVAGAIPDRVFDVGLQEDRPATDEERIRLMCSGEVRVQSAVSVRRVLTRFTIVAAIDNLKRGETSRYKDARDDECRQAVVDDVLERFLPIAFRPMNDRYHSALERGFLPPDAPPTPDAVARQHVLREIRRFAMFEHAFNQLMDIREAA